MQDGHRALPGSSVGRNERPRVGVGSVKRVSDQNVGYAIPPITNTALILANVIVFLYELAIPRAQLESFFLQWGAVPANISQFQSLPTLVTAMFLHAG